MDGLKPYFCTRSNWWKQVDLVKLAEELRDEFTVEELNTFDSSWELSFDKTEREKLRVKADTLTARLAPTRAFLFQKEAAHFTSRDLKLRAIILKLYGRGTISPLPFGYAKEPEYTVSDEVRKKGKNAIHP